MNRGWTITGKFVLEDNSHTTAILEMFVGYPMGTRDIACAVFGDSASNLLGAEWTLTEILSAENSAS